MTRIAIATDLKTRTSVPDKDARLKNSYVETKGDQSVVRKRPIAQGGVAIGTGQAQGGIGFTIGSTPYFIGFWADTMQVYTGSGTSWSSGTSYLTGAHVTVNFEDYWALADNTGSQPPSGNWSRSPVPEYVSPYSWTVGSKLSYNDTYSGNNRIAWNGSIYCTIDSLNGRSYTSVNGLVWTEHPYNIMLDHLGGFCITHNGTLFCAVNLWPSGMSQYSLTSSDGINWAYTFYTDLGSCSDIVSNGSLFLVTSTSGNLIMYSSNGTSWTTPLYASVGIFSSVFCAAWNGSVFCVFSGAVEYKAHTSINGSTWTHYNVGINQKFTNMKCIGNIIVMTSNENSYFATSSNNGATWTTGLLPTGGVSISTMSSNSTLLIAFLANSTNSYITTTDGITWTSSTVPVSKYFARSCYGNKFVVTDNTTVTMSSSTGL